MSLIDTLTLGEVEIAERIGKASISSLGDDAQPKGLIMAGLAYVLRRRDEPAFTVEQAKAMTMKEVSLLMRVDDDEDPTTTPDGSPLGD